MLAFITSLRHPDNAADYRRVESLLRRTLHSVTAQSNDDFVVIVVGNRVPSFALPPKVEFVTVDFAPPDAENGPHASREPFVLDKGSKIGIGLLAARRHAPDHVMIVDADDFVHRGLVDWTLQHPQSPGWVVSKGWMYSGLHGTARWIEQLHRTCGTSFILPFDAYCVPEQLNVDATQQQVVDAYGEVLPAILGAHRNALEWHAERGRYLDELPFAGAVYHVDTGENHSGKELTEPAEPITEELARTFGIGPDPLDALGLGARLRRWFGLG